MITTIFQGGNYPSSASRNAFSVVAPSISAVALNFSTAIDIYYQFNVPGSAAISLISTLVNINKV